MSGKARLTELAIRISEKRKDANLKDVFQKEVIPKDAILINEHTNRLEANPAHGEKGGFVKITITMPPAVYELIAMEAARRKMAKERDPNISAIIREASVQYLEGTGAKA